VKDVEVLAKTYYHQYLQYRQMASKDFQGVCLDDLMVLEQLFSLNVYVYDLQEMKAGDIAARLVRRSPYSYQETMNLNLHEDHFRYVNDMEKYSHSFLCSKCDRLWKHVGMLHRHERTSTGDVIYKYPGGVYHTPQTVFDRLEDENIDVPAENRYYPYRATYDIEVMLQPTDKQRSEKLEWTSHHVLLSVSVCSNVPGYTVPMCYISKGDTRKTVESCLSYLTEVSEEAYRRLMPKCGDVFQQNQERLDSDLDDVVDDEERDRQEKKHYLFKIYQQLERQLKELPVVGFNSGKYDVNTMKVDLFAKLVKRQKIKNTVERNNNCMCIKTEALKFLDITNYMAPGFSYSQYLKAYECTEEKGFFPYEWITSLEKLNVSQLPHHEAFYSTLKNGNISAEEYQLCQQVWKDNNMTTMNEFLTWYNNEEPKTCKIIGYDTNALYLWGIMQEMPTGHFVRRKSENQFQRDTPRIPGMLLAWT
jgi:hypothetical protein